jgi:hypothetical protein
VSVGVGNGLCLYMRVTTVVTVLYLTQKQKQAWLCWAKMYKKLSIED